MKRSQLAGLCLPLAVRPPAAMGQSTLPLPPQDKLLREIYQELIEFNTTDSAGEWTQAAKAMAARLKTGGDTDAEILLIVPPNGPKIGNLAASLKGTGAKKPPRLLACIDVVEAKREDGERAIRSSWSSENEKGQHQFFSKQFTLTLLIPGKQVHVKLMVA